MIWYMMLNFRKKIVMNEFERFLLSGFQLPVSLKILFKIKKATHVIHPSTKLLHFLKISDSHVQKLHDF